MVGVGRGSYSLPEGLWETLCCPAWAEILPTSFHVGDVPLILSQCHRERLSLAHGRPFCGATICGWCKINTGIPVTMIMRFGVGHRIACNTPPLNKTIFKSWLGGTWLVAAPLWHWLIVKIKFSLEWEQCAAWDLALLQRQPLER